MGLMFQTVHAPTGHILNFFATLVLFQNGTFLALFPSAFLPFLGLTSVFEWDTNESLFFYSLLQRENFNNSNNIIKCGIGKAPNSRNKDFTEVRKNFHFFFLQFLV